MKKQKDKEQGLRVLIDGEWLEAFKELKDTVKSIDDGLKRDKELDKAMLTEKCVPTIERFEDVEKQVFYPIPCPEGFSATIRIYASKMSREAITKARPIIRAEVAEEILNQMALERCDPDVMAYFEDYYWLPKSVWQALKERYQGEKK